MTNHNSEDLNFKFHWLDEKGNATTMFRKKGKLSGLTLTLEDSELPVAVIAHSENKDEVIALSLPTDDPENPFSLALIKLPSAKIARQLKKSLDISRSAVWAELHRTELEEKGEGHRFRSEVCPQCSASLILSDMPETSQLYCHFCDSLTTTDQSYDTVRQEKELRICDECGMYTRPQKFTIFYFYFLILFYGFWSKPTWRCPPCMRGEAWKMVFGNLIFILGFPFAVYQLIRSYGGSSIGGPFRGLDAGNITARKGDLGKALKYYRDILERVPVSAGVKYNLGLALIGQGNLEQAANSFELALADCCNYAPAYQQLCALYPQINEPEKLVELQRIWAAEEASQDEFQAEEDL